MPTISAMVNTYNEEKNIADCLESLAWVDELVVVDSGSTDLTMEIARSYAHKVISVSPGNFSDIRNEGLKHLTGEWVIVIDADERVTEELQREIKNSIAAESKQVGFQIPRKNFFMRQWIKYCGWYPDYVLRLFRNSREHVFSGLVHEAVLLKGEIGIMEQPLIHYTYNGLEQYLNKFNRYTTLSAEMICNKGRKINLTHLIIRPPLEFIKMFFLKRGFLDGLYGFIISYMSSMYVFVKFAKAWLKQKKQVSR